MALVLVVDDDPDIVETCRLVLQKEGHEVATATNPEEGMTAVHSIKPDLIILDVMMTEADDGFAMAQQLRREGFDNPILLLTSLTQVTGMQYDKQDEIVPVDAFLEKPTDARTLLQQVNNLLAAKEV